ncbi:MAG: hypothetical protein RDA78_24420 [Roseibium sp.]
MKMSSAGVLLLLAAVAMTLFSDVGTNTVTEASAIAVNRASVE